MKKPTHNFAPARCPNCSRVYNNANRKEFDKIRCGDCKQVFDI